MNFLRSSPFSALSAASLLQDFIFCCWLVLAWLLATDRHSDMNFLRSSPLSALSPASLLHEAIFSCWGVLVLSSAANTHSGAARIPAINHRLSIGFSFPGSGNRQIIHSARRLQHAPQTAALPIDRKSTRLNSSHQIISYAVFCLKKKSRRCRRM